MRKNQATTHRLDVSINGATWYQDFWVMFDYYLESTDIFPDLTHTPLVMLIDSSTDTVPGTTTPKLVGTPLFNRYVGEPELPGYNSLRPLTNILPASIQSKVIWRSPIDNSMAGKWINVKMHIKMDSTLAGLDLFVDGTQLTNPRIAEGEMPETIHFDLLRFWYHGDGSAVFPAPNTNVYFDNVGVYITDPDL
jgi:hypothetical protein